MNIESFAKTAFHCTVMITGLLLFHSGSVDADIILTETFNGTGAEEASNDMPGFDNKDWIAVGDLGTFASNGFGEQVLSVSNPQAVPRDGLFRIIGDQPFEIVAQFSNPQAEQLSSFGITIADFPNVVSLNVFKQQNGIFTSQFGVNENGNSYLGEHYSLGTSLERFTLKTTYSPDSIHGGGIFNFWIETEESGDFTYLGSIDGLIYSTDATFGRTLFLGTTGILSDSSVEIDHLTVSSIPEPTACLLMTFLAGVSCLKRNRTRQSLGC